MRWVRWFTVLAWVAGCGGDGGGEVDGGVDGVVDGDGDGPVEGALLREGFDVDGNGWPAGWSVLGGVASATVEGQRGRLVPTVQSYSLGRMGHGLGAVDVEATYVLSMDDVGRQGVGFYVRQNGGYLQQSATHGAGYAAFVEGFRGPRIGLWRERDGVEEEIGFTDLGAGGLSNGVVYAVRFRTVQAGAMTDLAAKIWVAAEAEPAGWTVMVSDGTAGLQGVGGGVAIDAWNTAQPGSGPAPQPVFVDDVVVRAAP